MGEIKTFRDLQRLGFSVVSAGLIALLVFLRVS
jgi:hypothetical protein